MTFSASGHARTAIQNYTIRFGLDQDDIDLRFLVHYVSTMRLFLRGRPLTRLRVCVPQIGDVHQPLHLTGRERGGNGDPVIFERRHMSLHGELANEPLLKARTSPSNDLLASQASGTPRSLPNRFERSTTIRSRSLPDRLSPL